jgi:hypothetical protein
LAPKCGEGSFISCRYGGPASAASNTIHKPSRRTTMIQLSASPNAHYFASAIASAAVAWELSCSPTKEAR